MKTQKSKKLFARAQKTIPGGVNSPVRAFKSVGGTPLFIKKAKGAYLYDVDGNQFIDFIASTFPLWIPSKIFFITSSQLLYFFLFSCHT